VLALLSACAFDGQLATDYRCGEGRTCPTGSHCVIDLCTLDHRLDAGSDPIVDAGNPGDPDASEASDAGDVDAATPATDASAAIVPRYSDDFGDGALTGWLPWTHPGCTVSETGGALQLDYTSGAAYCGADTAAAFDLSTGAVAVELVEAPAVATFEFYMILYAEAGQQIQMIGNGGGLTMQLRIDGTARGSSTITDPGDRFWRIHQEGTTTIWETSDDGATWSTRHSTTIAIDASAMAVELAGGGDSPAQVRFDSFSIE